MKPRLFLRNRFLLLADLFLIVVAAFGSFALRTDLGPLFNFYLPQAVWLAGIALLVKPLVFYSFGMYRRMWIYASTQELRLIVVSVTTASVLVSVVAVLLRALDILPYFPRSTLPIDWLLTMLLIGGLRFSLRVLADTQVTNGGGADRPRRALIVGAGDAGALVVREMQKNPNLHLTPVCFLDDNADKQKHMIHGVPVVGRLSDLPRALTIRHIDEVVIAIPSAPGEVIRRVADMCQRKGVIFRTMPGLYELLGGKVSVSRLREVEITDLLRREPAQITETVIGASLSGRRVLVTGAGGSIGQELCRQIARWGPSEMILLGHGENSIFEAIIDLEQNFPSVAQNFDIERLVMISTDKAIRPSSVMGATKRIAELLVLDAAGRSGKPYSVVRFGNVLGSRGSVIPLFKRQIAAGGPMTITHPDMRRYFMTIPEAVHLVLQASAIGKGGEVFVLRMGEQVRILDLAEDLIRLSGLEPYKDIDIVFTGIRPGEKLSEDLWDQSATYEPTRHPDIVQLVDENLLSGESLTCMVDDLLLLAQESDSAAIIRLLDECIPGAAVRSTPPPEITSVI
ncbi:MAG: hypothetical protein H6Q38_1637 [Chloroflexi bacterium]|nr:hypothetical protein [Chloroflexota bacterium]